MRRAVAYFKRRAGDILIAVGGLTALSGSPKLVTAVLFLAGVALWTLRLARMAAAKRRERRPTLDPFGNQLLTNRESDRVSRPS